MGSLSGGLIVKEIRVQKALSKSGLPEYDYSLNPYIGCQHACVYCYAIDFTRGEPAERWGEVVYVKINLIPVLMREVRKYRPGVVGVSTITDPYIPIEARYKLTRRSIELLLAYGFSVSIQTKSALVIRDLDVLRKYRDKVDVGFTITTLDPSIKKLIEPYSSHPLAIERALRKISSEGIKTWIFIGPIIPDINDHLNNLVEIVDLAKETGSEVIIDYLRQHPRAMINMRIRLGEDLMSKILSKNTYSWWRSISEKILSICKEKNVVCKTASDYWREFSIRSDSETLY
jgi:DNA repair photolyase